MYITHTNQWSAKDLSEDGRLQSLDWTSGLDWWTNTKNHFMLFNKTYFSVELCENSSAFSLHTQSWNK